MDGELKRPASEGATKEWDRRSKDGFFLLSQCLSSNQLHHIKHLIKDIQCGPKAWKILKDVHAPSSEAMVEKLERQLHAVKINEGDAVQGTFDQLRDLYVKLSAAGVDYPENIKCFKALSLLPESWGPLVVNLNGMKDSWSLEWIRAQVLQEEFRRKELTVAAGEGGGSAYGMKGFKGRSSKKGKAKEGSGGEQYSGGKRSNKGGKRCGGKCWYCHVEGHPWFKCRKLPDGWRPGQPSIEGFKGVHGAMGEGMGSEEGDGGAGGHGSMFYHVGEACSEDMVVPASKVALHRSSHWVIDTGAFMTMTNREDLLDEVRPSKAATVVSATGQVVPVRGEGRAMFMGADGRLVGLKRVLLVPGLCANLLSTKALSEARMKMEMMGTKVFKATLDGCVLWDLRGGKDMHRSIGGGGDGSDGGLLVHGGGALPSVTPSMGETDRLTAHRRFGHVALLQLQQLFKEERVKGLRIKGEPKEVSSCETCLTSKFSRFPFHSTVGQSSDPVELVHVELVGPMKVKGDSGALYSMTMVDDYTRLTWSFPLAKKIDAARVIVEEWLPMMERESGKRVKAIRSDRGGEFLGAEFRSWLKRHGIKQQLTTAYTPQSNGVAERANRTIIEGGRTILVDSGLPLRFWPLAIRHATIIKNRVLTHVERGSTRRHRPEHMAAAKRVLRYLCSTSGLGLVLGGRRPVVLTGHADASWADDQATQRSSQGYTFSLGSGSVSWRSTRSSSVLGSSCEAEIYVGAMAAQELRWLTYLLTDLGEPPRSPPVLYIDNKAMLALCREHRLEHRTKHIALRYFLARELQQRSQLCLAYVASEANNADIFTKALPPGDHQRFCTMLGLVPTWPHLLTS
ncbi:unnamed protein product [Closterium sp. NIES-54]